MQHKWLKVIAALEVIGSVYGLGLILLQLIERPIDTGVIILATIVTGIYFFALAAGLALWQGLKIGRNASIIVQLVQFPKIITNPVVFQFSFGLDLYVLFYKDTAISNLGLHMKYGAFHQLFFDISGAPFGVGFSVVALVFTVMLLREKHVETTHGNTP